jgi:hypothetical protein
MTNGDDKHFRPTLGYSRKHPSSRWFWDLANMKINKCKKFLCPRAHQSISIRVYVITELTNSSAGDLKKIAFPLLLGG